MALVRHGGALMRRFLISSCQTKRLALAGVYQSHRMYGSVPDDMDLTHLEGERQIQPIDEFPLTPEKRAKLAAKYNLRPEDYVPLTDGDITLGDYPKLPRENCLERDPFYDWDDPFYRRNWGEPIFHEMEAFTPVYGVDTRSLPYDRPQMWKYLLGFVGVMAVLYTLGDMYPSFLPRAPKQYPEYYPGDEFRSEKLNSYDFMEGRYTDNPRVKERVPVVNYTFPKNWDPAAH